MHCFYNMACHYTECCDGIILYIRSDCSELSQPENSETYSEAKSISRTLCREPESRSLL